jgi:hypothetical protein
MLQDNRPEFVQAVVGRALVVLFNRQTASEKQTNHTKMHNDIGFTGADAYSGTITAKYYLKHKSLLDWQVRKWTKTDKNGYPRLAKYWKQLDEAARARAAA